MLIIGCDFHPSFQQVAIFDNRTGEIEEKRLQHREEAEQFYRSLAGQQGRVGMEACGAYYIGERASLCRGGRGLFVVGDADAFGSGEQFEFAGGGDWVEAVGSSFNSCSWLRKKMLLLK